uniref:Uncharacterized protein n=1 Tax=Curvibacter symbiont subsp. Hydra magnipapillata TaxID=667019 RepID=C9Y8D2_CURXX|nr:hypothetical protein Csp_A03830 [Curvibacter putative symbiont of Hydra magnipapillata]
MNKCTFLKIFFRTFVMRALAHSRAADLRFDSVNLALFSDSAMTESQRGFG